MSEAVGLTDKQASRSKPVKRTGTVVSDKGDKTIKVEFRYAIKHPKYGKYLQRTTTLHTHDEKNEAKVGDLVQVVSTRKMSKTKCWRLEKILESTAHEG